MYNFFLFLNNTSFNQLKAVREQLQLLTQTPFVKQKKREKSKKDKRKKEKRKGSEVQKTAPPGKVHKRSSSSKSTGLVNSSTFALFLVCILCFCWF